MSDRDGSLLNRNLLEKAGVRHTNRSGLDTPCESMQVYPTKSRQAGLGKGKLELFPNFSLNISSQVEGKDGLLLNILTFSQLVAAFALSQLCHGFAAAVGWTLRR